MGMYDYLGEEQVKCFTVPLVHVSCHAEDLKDCNTIFSSSGGRLTNYIIGDDVPYQTKFYSYGLDFIVFDYRAFNDAEVPMLHVIQGGKYVASYSADSVPEDLKISLVVNNYGTPLNITKPSDFAVCADEDKASDDLYDAILAEKCQELGISIHYPSRDEFLSMGKEAMAEYFKKRKEAQDIACKNSFDVFRNKWILPNTTHDPTMIGCVLSVYEERPYPEWCWYQLIHAYMKLANDTYGCFENALNKYVAWANEHNVSVDMKEIHNIFHKYSQPIPQKVIDDYLQTETYKSNVTSYKILHKDSTNPNKK